MDKSGERKKDRAAIKIHGSKFNSSEISSELDGGQGHTTEMTRGVSTALSLFKCKSVAGLWTLSCDLAHHFLLKH